ncbi:hypothetical protein L2Y96_03660 [Luteibacter aegosomaticola]|uniref:hypothetical protein n=1 Tax=Luteibacter aegosomaticola TaxID=2911538 RepID=UPI001FFBA938|nr:hypothetical protein [Luteibacter aegosomaticola]UPG90884.1 hypothetical protein L2Y96_03660 [Luteibacter aegosomaticola]
MSDSIDFLEAIGRDASLRRLRPDELARRLKEAGASDVLARAAEARDSNLLCEEFGVRVMYHPNGTDSPFREAPKPLKVPSPGEDQDDEGEDDAPQQSLPALERVH